MKLKIAIAGCGTMGHIYAKNLAQMKSVQLVAVYDYKMESARRLADQHRIHAYSSYTEMLQAEDPDIVCITLPTFLHKEYVLEAASRGKHVICEKPIALHVEDAREMIAACKANEVRLFIGHVVRFAPENKKLHAFLSSGGIGNVGVVHTKRSGPHPGTAGNWYTDSARTGGVILDLMIHDIDFMRSLFGEVKTVYALNQKTEAIDYALVTLRMHSGAIINMESCWGYPAPFFTAAEYAGDKGILRSDRRESQSFRLLKSNSDPAGAKREIVPPSLSFRDPYYYQLAHFVDCIAHDTAPIVSAEDGLKAVEIAQAAIKSAQTSMPIELQSDEAISVSGGA